MLHQEVHQVGVADSVHSGDNDGYEIGILNRRIRITCVCVCVCVCACVSVRVFLCVHAHVHMCVVSCSFSCIYHCSVILLSLYAILFSTVEVFFVLCLKTAVVAICSLIMYVRSGYSTNMYNNSLKNKSSVQILEADLFPDSVIFVHLIELYCVQLLWFNNSLERPAIVYLHYVGQQMVEYKLLF